MKSRDDVAIVSKFFNFVISSNRIAIALLILFCCGSFFLRVLPLLSLQGDLLYHIDPYDSLYLLRQVERMQANFPSYNFFDPMTFFPAGANIQWGPAFPFIVTMACLVAGATTRRKLYPSQSLSRLCSRSY